MPFTMPNYPLLTPEQSNPLSAGITSALKMYAALQGFDTTKLQQEKQKIENKYAGPKAEEEIEKLKQFNKWYGPEKESEIGLRGAQTGLTGKQSQKLGLEMPFVQDTMRAELEFKKAQAKAQEALAGQHGLESQKLALLLDKIKGGLGGQNTSAQTGSVGETNPMGNAGQSGHEVGPFGVEIPKPSSEDIVNKELYGEDTFKTKYENALKEQQKQLKMYTDKTNDLNSRVQSNVEFSQDLIKYNQLMNETSASGPYGSFIPSTFSPGKQMIQNLIAKMSIPAVRSLRTAMGAGRFSIPEFTAALAQKPQDSWSRETRRMFTDNVNTGMQRDYQENQFYNHVKSNQDKLKLDMDTADIIWSVFEKNNPILSSDGRKLLKENTLGQKWRNYLTPEAIKSIKETGDYKPTERYKNDDLEFTAKKYGISKEKAKIMIEAYDKMQSKKGNR